MTFSHYFSIKQVSNYVVIPTIWPGVFIEAGILRIKEKSVYLAKTVLPFSLKGDDMQSEKAENRDIETKGRTVNLPAWIWKELEADSERCKRSITRHIEAILECYYDPMANVELDREAINRAYDVVSDKRKTA